MKSELETLVQKVRKSIMHVVANALLLGLAASAHAQQAPQISQPLPQEAPTVKVGLRFYDPETQTTTQALRPGKTYELQVTGDNRGLNAKTVEFILWDLAIPRSLDFNALQPNPKYENDFFREEGPDEKFRMSQLQNSVRTDYSVRATRELNTSNSSIWPGPTNRFGIVDSYHIVPKAESVGHGGVITLDRAIAYGGPGIVHAQPIQTQHYLMFAVSDGGAPVLSIMRDHELEEVNRIFVVEGDTTRSVLEHTTTLTGDTVWNALYNNTTPGLNYELTDTLDFNAPARFYRARVLP